MANTLEDQHGYYAQGAPRLVHTHIFAQLSTGISAASWQLLASFIQPEKLQLSHQVSVLHTQSQIHMSPN